MKLKIIYLAFFILLMIPFVVCGESTRQERQQLKELDDYINDTNDGSDFNQAVVLSDTCDYSGCKSDECIVDVFEKTVFKRFFIHIEVSV